MVEVVAALIRRGGKFMICRRPQGKARALMWEFVGGKIEPGETPQQALVRECREELAIEVTPADVFASVTHVYPDITIRLTLFNCAIASGEPQLLEHCAIAWITPDEIDCYTFCPADRDFLDKLKAEFLG